MSEVPTEIPGSYGLDKLEHRGRFVSPVRNTHRKEQYVFVGEENKETPRILKFLPPHSARAEVIGSSVFQALDLRAPSTFYVESEGKAAVIMEDLSLEYAADLSYGEGGVMVDPELKKQFQDSILAAVLIGDYDRVPWNTMISRDYEGVAHVDFGACCGSRAQGGFNGFSDSIKVEDIRQVLADPYDLNVISNAAYQEMLDIRGGELNILQPERLKALAEQVGQLGDDKIDAIVDTAGWPDNSTPEGSEANQQFLSGTIMRLERDMSHYTEPSSLNHIKTKRAIETYTKMRDEFKGDIAGYYKHALKARRDDIVQLFTQ